MKIIFSRKGFDLEYGGFPSPILPDNRLISLPIPYDNDICYSELQLEGYGTYFDIISSLNGRIKKNKEWQDFKKQSTCHLDPDLRQETYIGHDKETWTPLFGQSGAAQSHLENEEVLDPKNNDLFLFFGTFRRTAINDEGRLKFVRTCKPLHVIYGYFQIGQIIKVNEKKSEIKSWMEYHPHIVNCNLEPNNNTVYVARDNLTWNSKLKGAGTFLFDERLVLTKEGFSKSRWKLDAVFRNVKISCHSDKNWNNQECYFQTNGIGQEFVIHADEHVERWAKDLINRLKVQ